MGTVPRWDAEDAVELFRACDELGLAGREPEFPAAIGGRLLAAAGPRRSSNAPS
jgi:hypothetical protein